MTSTYLCRDVGACSKEQGGWFVRRARLRDVHANDEKKTHYKTQRDGTYESSSSIRALRAAAVVVAVAAESVLVLLWVCGWAWALSLIHI